MCHVARSLFTFLPFYPPPPPQHFPSWRRPWQRAVWLFGCFGPRGAEHVVQFHRFGGQTPRAQWPPPFSFKLPRICFWRIICQPNGAGSGDVTLRLRANSGASENYIEFLDRRTSLVLHLKKKVFMKNRMQKWNYSAGRLHI